MEIKAAYIISLKFAPGLRKEFTVIGGNLYRCKINVKYIISQKYSSLGYLNGRTIYVPTGYGTISMINDAIRSMPGLNLAKIFSKDLPSLVVFYNPHPLNPRIARYIKRNYPKAITALYLHDPFKPDKSPYGWIKSLYITIAEKVQDFTVKYMDHVISPSEYSQKLFKIRHPHYRGKTHLCPLLVPDTFRNQRHDHDRKYFSMVGGAHKATGHDTFINLVNYAAEKNLGYEFCMISSSDLSGFLEKLTEKGRRILKVINEKIITDSEIDDVVRQSYTVFRLAREVTQSGVIPVSYMNATPVIATDIPGHSQHVWHKETGYLISSNPEPEEVVRGMEYVRTSFPVLSKKARKAYENIWAEWNFEKYYGWMMDRL